MVAARSRAPGWHRGRVLEEIALLNRVVETMTANPVCVFDHPSVGTVTSEWYVLHRRGPGSGSPDLFGADLAVTVWKAPASWLKTAFFQLKTSRNYGTRLDRRQLGWPQPILTFGPVLFLVVANAGNRDL